MTMKAEKRNTVIDLIAGYTMLRRAMSHCYFDDCAYDLMGSLRMEFVREMDADTLIIAQELLLKVF